MRPFTCAVTLVICPVSPVTKMFDGYGDDGPTLGTVITPVLQNVVSVTVVALSTRWVMVPLLVSNPLAPL